MILNRFNLICSSCKGELLVAGRVQHKLITVCSKCGASSANQIEKEYKRKVSGVQKIDISTYRPQYKAAK